MQSNKKPSTWGEKNNKKSTAWSGNKNNTYAASKSSPWEKLSVKAEKSIEKQKGEVLLDAEESASDVSDEVIETADAAKENAIDSKTADQISNAQKSPESKQAEQKSQRVQFDTRNPEKGGSKKGIIIAVISVVLVAALGVGAWLFFKKGNDDKVNGATEIGIETEKETEIETEAETETETETETEAKIESDTDEKKPERSPSDIGSYVGHWYSGGDHTFELDITEYNGTYNELHFRIIRELEYGLDGIISKVDGDTAEFTAHLGNFSDSKLHGNLTFKPSSIVMNITYSDDMNSFPNGEIVFDEVHSHSKIPYVSGGDWKTAYLNYYKTWKNGYRNSERYFLKDVDSDGIPELFLDYGVGYKGTSMITVSGSELYDYGIGRAFSVSYVKSDGTILVEYSGMGYSSSTVYRLKKGDLKLIDSGMITLDNGIERYYWNDDEISADSYNECLNKAFDKTSAENAFEDALDTDELLIQLGQNYENYDDTNSGDGSWQYGGYSVPFTAKINVNELNIRSGPGTEYQITGTMAQGTYTIVEVKGGTGSLTGWGKLKSGVGWISLDYTELNTGNDQTGGIYDDGKGDDPPDGWGEPNVWCPVCGNGYFTTGFGNDGLLCNNCGNRWLPTCYICHAEGACSILNIETGMFVCNKCGQSWKP